MEPKTQTALSLARLQEACQPGFEEITGFEDHLLSMHFDLEAVCALGRRVLENVRPFAEQAEPVGYLKKQDVADLEEYLRHLERAHARYLEAKSWDPLSPQDLHAPLIERRTMLLVECQSLIARGLLPEDALKELQGTTTQITTAFDVLALCALLRSNWRDIGTKIGPAIDDVQRVEAEAEQLLSAAGGRVVWDVEVETRSEKRKAAFVRFAHAYDEVRRGMSALRWDEGDADNLIPSLYSTRRGGRA